MEYGSFRAEEFGDLQRLVDGLFYDRHAIDRLDLIVQAEILDLAPDLMEIVNLLPPGYYDRQSLCPGRPRLGRRLRHRGINLVI